jgi:D-xylose reductase
MSYQSVKDMPNVGFGLWKISPEDCESAVYEAIQAGYRHFDAACDYGNEAEVGNGLRRAMSDGLCQREDLWITSKLWNTYHHSDNVPMALNRTLRDLQIDYLDLYLIHFPIALEYVEFETRYPPEWVHEPDAASPVMKPARVPLQSTWQAMEQLKKSGKVKHIGVCNYSTGLLHDLMNYCEQAPEILQIESHPYLTQTSLIRLAHQYGLEVTAFSPLGSLSYVELEMADSSETILELPVIEAIADRIDKTPAQVILRWGIQRGTSLVVKSVKPERMKENLALADFSLTDADMAAIFSLNINRRFNDPGQFCEEAFNTFHPIYD